jgi:putative transcription factor
MLCEMCSSKSAVLRADVEGAKLSVCEQCSRFGKVLSRVQAPITAKAKKQEAAKPAFVKSTESVQLIRSDYSKIIKQAREKLGLTQEDFAKRLTERESMLHKIESGHLKPDLALARKLEKALRISLVEQVEVEVGGGEKKNKGEGLTLGDLIKIK